MCAVETSHIVVAEFCANVDIIYLISFLCSVIVLLQPFLLYASVSVLCKPLFQCELSIGMMVYLEIGEV